VRIWTRFCLLPLQKEGTWENGREYIFDDWRFTSLVPFTQAIRDRWINNAAPFRLMARVDGTGKLVAVRYIGSAGGGDSDWQPPVTPKGRSGLRRLIGLDD
jgi:hypothetical protein